MLSPGLDREITFGAGEFADWYLTFRFVADVDDRIFSRHAHDGAANDFAFFDEASATAFFDRGFEQRCKIFFDVRARLIHVLLHELVFPSRRNLLARYDTPG